MNLKNLFRMPIPRVALIEYNRKNKTSEQGVGLMADKKNEDIEFGARLKALRHDKMHYSQDKFADLINEKMVGRYYDKRAVSKWENGFYRPEPVTYPVIAEILGVTVDELLTGKGSISVEWEVRNQLHSVEHMLTFLKATARQSHFTQTLKILPMMEKIYGDAMADVQGGEVPFIVHPLTVACHAVALGFKDDHILSVALLHDALDRKGVNEEDLPVDEETLVAIRLLSTKYTPSKKFSIPIEQVYESIKQSRTACFVKVIARCHNVSVVAMSMSKEKIARYIKETEQYVLPLIDYLRYTWPDFYDAAYLLKYHIQTALEIMKRML